MPLDTAASNARSDIKFSSSARAKLRSREKDVFNYYDDIGLGRGNCTWGKGGAAATLQLVDQGNMHAAAAKISSMIMVRVKTKKGTKMVVAHGLIARRAEESAPFRK